MVVFHVQRDLKDLNRLRQILQVFVQEGLGHYLIQAKLHRGPALPLPRSAQLAGLHLRHAFERLGPSFVKLGQLLSVRTDLVPLPIAQELEKLQDHVSPFPFAQVKKILEQEWGRPLEQVLAIEETPLAAASVSQVHRARLPSGEQVIVKVQRPGAAELLEVDLDILFHLSYMLDLHVPALHPYRLQGVVREFAYWSRREMDFSQEALSALRLRAAVHANKQVLVPRVYRDLCTHRVFVQEFVSGTKLNQVRATAATRKRLAMTYFTSLLEQALVHGFFHADPHPANIFVDRRGRITFLDYGIMGTLTSSDRLKVIRFIHSLKEKNAEKSLEIIYALARDTTHARREEWQREALPLLEEVYHHSLKERSIGKAIYELISLGGKYQVIFDPNHLLIAKCIYQAEGLGLQLYPGFQVREGFNRFAKNTLISKRTLLKKALQTLVAKTEELPEQLQDFLSPHPPSASLQLDDLRRELAQSNKRRNFSLLAALFFLAGMLLLSGERSSLLGISLQAIVFCFAGFFLLLLIKTHRGEYDGEIR